MSNYLAKVLVTMRVVHNFQQILVVFGAIGKFQEDLLTTKHECELLLCGAENKFVLKIINLKRKI
jgi:hypothetical protein